MQEKLIVQFASVPAYGCKSDYLVYCKGCNSYYINNHEPCYKCGSLNKFASIDSIAQKIVRRDFLNRVGFVLIIYLLLFLLSMDFKTIIFISIYTLACILLNFLIYALFKPSFFRAEYEKYISLNQHHIKNDLEALLKKAEEKIQKEDYITAYRDLGYLGMLLDSERLRLDKINCLRHFRLRADLPLEMKELLVNEFNKYLVYYIYEAAKLKRELVDEAVIKYIMQNKESILDLPEGEKIVATVIIGALKSKYLTHKYAWVIYEYIDYLPKDRLIRLLKIKDCISDRTLVQQIKDKIRMKYGSDEDLSKYL